MTKKKTTTKNVPTTAFISLQCNEFENDGKKMKTFDYFNRHNEKPINQLCVDCVLVEFHRTIFTKYDDDDDGADEEKNENASTRV